VELREFEPMDADQVHSKFKDTLQAIEGFQDLEFLHFKIFDRQNARSIRMVVTKQQEI